MERLARFVMHHRRIVALSWLVLFVVGGIAASGLGSRLTFDFSLPGQPGYEAEQHLIHSYGVSSDDTFVATLSDPAGGSLKSESRQVAAVFDAVRHQVPGVRLIDQASTGDSAFASSSDRTSFALIQGPQAQGFGPGLETKLGPALTKAAAAAHLRGGLTSYEMLSAGGDSNGPSVLAETLIGAAGALLVLIFVFASFLALLPMLIAAVSILTTFLLVLRADDDHRRELRRAVPHLADRPGRGHRLLAAPRVALARRAGARPRQRRGGGHRDAHRRPRRPRVRRDRRDQPRRPRRRPRSVPAQHGTRRHADPARQRRGGAHPAAGVAVEHRPAGRLAADPA